MEALIKLGIFLLLAAIGFWRGRRNERAHLAALASDEAALAGVLVFSTRVPPRMDRPQDPVLVSGSAVIGSDHFRLLLAALRKIVGGNYRAYENLMERARRQAVIRLKEAARAHGADMVFGLRFATSRISDPRRGESTQVEVIAYGTAFVPAVGTVAESRVRYCAGDHPAPEEPFDLMKNRYSRFWVLAWFALLPYCFIELVTANRAPPSWRYVDGAPWAVFAVLGTAAAIALAVAAKRRAVPLGHAIVLALLSAPLLCPTQYFLALRINAATAAERPRVGYTLSRDHVLVPDDPRWPRVGLRDYAGFWITQPVGTRVELPVACGWLGFCQYDLMPLKARYQDFYRTH